MKHQLLKLSALLFLCISLFSYISCSDDKDEDRDCGKDIYDPMEHNPAKEVDWIRDMIKSRGEVAYKSYVDLYKLDEDVFYLSDLHNFKNPRPKLSIYWPQFIYRVDGSLYASSERKEDVELYQEFKNSAVHIKTLWLYESCDRRNW